MEVAATTFPRAPRLVTLDAARSDTEASTVIVRYKLSEVRREHFLISSYVFDYERTPMSAATAAAMFVTSRKGHLALLRVPRVVLVLRERIEETVLSWARWEFVPLESPPRGKSRIVFLVV